MQTVVDNVLINYEVLGSKNTNSIVILHGWKRSLRDWQTIANKWSKKYKVVLVDLPGMGSSSMPSYPLDTFGYASLISEFLKKLNLTKVILLGHSFGGKVAIIIAAKNTVISKLVLVDASGIDEKKPEIKLKTIVAKILKPIKLILPKSFENLFKSNDYQTAGNLLPSFKKIVIQNIENEAKQITIPTLIIWGDKDKEVTILSAKKLNSLIKNSLLRIVWGTHHDPFLEKPEKFLEIVDEFIMK